MPLVGWVVDLQEEGASEVGSELPMNWNGEIVLDYGTGGLH